jgi:predicted transcriptional regulator
MPGSTARCYTRVSGKFLIRKFVTDASRGAFDQSLIVFVYGHVQAILSPDTPRTWLMAHAIKTFVEQEEWFIREVEHGIEAADKGRLKEHADVKAKWEARRAAEMD